MATFTKAQIQLRAQKDVGTKRTVTAVLKEEIASIKTYNNFDIFLSHSSSDANTIRGVKGVLEDFNYKVYVDWLEDPNPDRNNVTVEVADLIRWRMSQCKSLIYVHSVNSGFSKWMPWELGYFDGLIGAVAILPITETRERSYRGQEYLGIYPHLRNAINPKTKEKALGVAKVDMRLKSFDSWVKSPEAPFVRAKR